jgi:hypothetical protein
VTPVEERRPRPPLTAEELGGYLTGTLAPAEHARVAAALAQDPLTAEVVGTWQEFDAEGLRPEERLAPTEVERGWRSLVAELEADLPPQELRVHPRLLRPVTLYPVATLRRTEDAAPAPRLSRERDERWLKLLLVDPQPLPGPLQLELRTAHAAKSPPAWQEGAIELDESRTLWLELPADLAPGEYELRLVDPGSGDCFARWQLDWTAG